MDVRHRYCDLLYHSSISHFRFSGGGVWCAAGLFQTSCYYILVTNQPPFWCCLPDFFACVGSFFSPDKDLNVPNSKGLDRNPLSSWTLLHLNPLSMRINSFCRVACSACLASWNNSNLATNYQAFCKDEKNSISSVARESLQFKYFAVRQLNRVRLGDNGNDTDTTSLRDEFFCFHSMDVRHRYCDLLYHSSISHFRFSGGGVWCAAGLFQTSCYYILVTNQPHFDAACLTSLRALEAYLTRQGFECSQQFRPGKGLDRNPLSSWTLLHLNPLSMRINSFCRVACSACLASWNNSNLATNYQAFCKDEKKQHFQCGQRKPAV